jgi:tetratricopeptide (TPR) repeat protein
LIGRWRHRLWRYWLARCTQSAALNNATKRALLALAHVPGRAFTAFYCAGQLCAAAGDQPSAIELYQRALGTGTVRDPTLYHQLGVALMALGRYAEAEAQLLQSIAHKPWAWWSCKALGELMLQQSRLAEAEGWLRRTLELNTADPWVYYHLFVSERARVGWEAALDSWLDAILAAPQMAELAVDIGILWVEPGDFTLEHTRKLRQVADRYPDNQQVRFLLGCLLSQLGEATAASETLAKYMAHAWEQGYGTRADPRRPVKDPEFLIIGTGKGGSTALYDYLVDHPLVCPAVVKEVNFWTTYFSHGYAWYRACFMPIPAGAPQITGEGSIASLWHDQAPSRVAEFRPDMKLLLIIRDPVARAWSDYQMRRRLGHNLPAWEALVERELQQFPQCPLSPEDLPGASCKGSVLLEGAVLPYLKRWRRHFTARQFLVLRNEDLSRDVQHTVDIAYDFLGLPRHTLSSTARSNVGNYAALSPAVEQRLRDWYQPHQDALSNFLATEMA